ncbi:MAG: tyrosine-protein phosphatase [Ilumatobacteraceae bacterium]
MTAAAAAPSRNLELAGVFNFRDLGGYEAADGRTVRWRTIFRADGLGRLTTEDLEVLRPIGLRTVVDLRTGREIDERGRFPHEHYPVTFHHLSVIDQTWDREAALAENLPPTEFLHRTYHEMLVDGGPRFAAAFELLSHAAALPAVFHCAAGKDRTGLLAALILGALGVGHDDVVEDYALTQVTMDAFLAKSAAGDEELARRIESAPQSFFTADPAAMSLVLTDLERAHGSVRGFVSSLGVSDAVLERLDALLLTAD